MLGWLSFAIAPVGIEAIDSGIPDHCGAAIHCTPQNGLVVDGIPSEPPLNATECESSFNEGRAEREENYDEDGAYAIHTAMEACPSGCCFAPRWSHAEHTRWYDAVIKMLVLTLPAVMVGLTEQKAESFCYLMVGVLALAYYAYYLWGTFELQELCTAQGHDNLSPQQATHYGNDHVCQTTTSTVVILVPNIIVAIVAIAGGAVAGALYQEPAEIDFDNGATTTGMKRAKNFDDDV